jgi:phosphate starvation-inducible PhoH-like protein
MTELSPVTGEFAEGRTQLEFDDNLLLPLLYGERDQHLDRIERQLGVSVVTRGNRLAISGSASATEAAHLALSQLYERLKRGQEVDLPAVEAAIRLAEAELGDKSLDLWREDAAFRTRKRRITARSPGQAAYIKAMRDNELVFGLGPAGTGKTYLAVAAAVDLLMTGRVERIILSRPARRSILICGRSSTRLTTCCRRINWRGGSAPARSRWRRSPLCGAARCRMPLSFSTKRKTRRPCK